VVVLTFDSIPYPHREGLLHAVPTLREKRSNVAAPEGAAGSRTGLSNSPQAPALSPRLAAGRVVGCQRTPGKK
jgi:hypothetical protein